MTQGNHQEPKAVQSLSPSFIEVTPLLAKIEPKNFWLLPLHTPMPLKSWEICERGDQLVALFTRPQVFDTPPRMTL